ncbi:unnamed protein product [Rotaria sordida]|uniref:Uncharacterized protein n=1 Tax=Rotaria sordida TaxID=392033 RepID=A0A813ZSW4_9BILA|nr:unnamed protein product [Rotaria sordida]CAF1290314.1 unnamed protein product [Rotaria sordida]
MKVPNLSLKEAIRRVPDFSTVLPSCVDSSIVSSSAKKGLTKEDAAAIRLYTIECPVYKLLNAALRTEELKNIEPWFPYLKLFNIAISKLTPKKGTYCRGINGNLNSLYPVGSIVTWIIEIFLILAVLPTTLKGTVTTSKSTTTSKPTTTTSKPTTTTSKLKTTSKTTTKASKPTRTSSTIRTSRLTTASKQSSSVSTLFKTFSALVNTCLQPFMN